MRSLLTIAGSDSGGGAGIQADLKAFWDHGWHGASVITSVTAQHTAGVTRIDPVPLAGIAAQLDAVLSDLDIAAIKIGMLGNADTVGVVAEKLRNFDGPIVLDPVMVSTSGHRLLDADAVEALQALHDQVSWTCPNQRELALLGTPAELVQRGVIVVETGGDAETDSVIDRIHLGDGSTVVLDQPRLSGGPFHGTGCTMSSALAALVATQPEWAAERCVRTAIAYVRDRLATARQVGSGSWVLGPCRDL